MPVPKTAAIFSSLKKLASLGLTGLNSQNLYQPQLLKHESNQNHHNNLVHLYIDNLL